jgi:hypothetical protein
MSASLRSSVLRLAGLLAVAALVIGFVGSVQAHQPAHAPLHLPPRGTQSVTLGCAASVLGPTSPGWLSPSNGTLVAGPIAWPVLRRYAGSLPAAGLAPRDGLAPAVKALVGVAIGTVVRVSVPASERTRLSLYYITADPRNAAGHYRVADGERDVTFDACAPGPGVARTTQFAGYFIVAGAQCARIDIYTTASRQPLRRQIPFGVPQRSCPATG